MNMISEQGLGERGIKENPSAPLWNQFRDMELVSPTVPLFTDQAPRANLPGDMKDAGFALCANKVREVIPQAG